MKRLWFSVAGLSGVVAISSTVVLFGMWRELTSVLIPVCLGAYLQIALANQSEVAMRSVSLSTRVGSDGRPLVVTIAVLCLVGAVIRLAWLLT